MALFKVNHCIPGIANPGETIEQAALGDSLSRFVELGAVTPVAPAPVVAVASVSTEDLQDEIEELTESLGDLKHAYEVRGKAIEEREAKNKALADAIESHLVVIVERDEKLKVAAAELEKLKAENAKLVAELDLKSKAAQAPTNAKK